MILVSGHSKYRNLYFISARLKRVCAATLSCTMWKKRATKPKILIVEDDQYNHPIFRDAFSAAGFEVLISDTAEHNFVEAVAAFAPDIISMDLMIGKSGVTIARDGFDAMDLLRADERTRSIPIIVCSNFMSEEKLQKAKAYGALDFYHLQGQPITQVAARFKDYTERPDHYRPSHPLFRTS